ncbi:MAG TPA: hypothetical protein PLT05_06355, partial [bacterium]|nr:hypothetical protein [bacterium]
QKLEMSVDGQLSMVEVIVGTAARPHKDYDLKPLLPFFVRKGGRRVPMRIRRAFFSLQIS